MKSRSLGLFASLALLMGLPTLSFAMPITWNYLGYCEDGDCDVVPTVTGTLTGDPTLWESPNQLNDYVFFGDIISYSFQIGSYAYSGTGAAGTYFLDSAGNIVDGWMTFGDLVKLEFLGVGAAKWTFTDSEHIFDFEPIYASGNGGYTKVPEPGMLSLLGLGLLGFGFIRRRRA